jgi:hypothetical protein
MPNAAARGKGGGGGSKGGGKGAGGGGLGGAADGVRWDCGMCGLAANFAWRTRCRGCEAYRKRGEGGPLAVSRDPTLTLAERQVRQQRQAQRAQRETSATERKLREEVEKLQGQLAASQSNNKTDKLAGAAGEDGCVDVDAELDELEAADGYSSWTEEERRKQIETSRAALTYMVGKYGEASAEATSVRDEISALERASRGAKPFKAHRSLLERRRDRLRARIRKDEDELEKAEAEQEELQKKVEGLRSSMAERNGALRQVEEELAELIKRALAEGDAAGEAGKAGDGGATAWSAQAASTTLQNLAALPGIPPEFATLLAHVHQAAMALAQAAEGARSQERGDDSADTSGKGGKPPAAATRSTKGGTGAAAAAESTASAQQQQQPQQRAGVAPAGSAASSGEEGAGKPADTRTPGGEGTAENKQEPGNDGGGGAMEVDMEETIRKLPEQDREKVWAAIRGGVRRRWSDEDGAERGSRREREERERSPRPTKNDGDL